MTASELARSLHGVKAGKRWSCKCPVIRMHAHGDRTRSLSVWESEDGWVCLKCFAGCSRDEILTATGLQIRDLALNGFAYNPEWEQRRREREELAILETRQGAFILNQTLDRNNRNYWRAAERNITVEIQSLRGKLYPSEKHERDVERIINEYGFDELWDLLP